MTRRRRPDADRPAIPRLSQRELEDIAYSSEPVAGAMGVVAVAEHTPGRKLPSGYPAGVGGETLYGAAWLIGGRIKSEPFVLVEHPRDAAEICRIIQEADTPWSVRPEPEEEETEDDDTDDADADGDGGVLGDAPEEED